MKAMILATLAATALGAYAGEDSTHRSGPAGTGPAFWEAPCGLKGFAGPGAAPCSGQAALAADASTEQTQAWMEQHRKAMDEMMGRMKAEHGAMMGGSRAHAVPSAEGDGR